MASQIAQQIIKRHMLPNISRSRDNEGQLIEYNRNIFLEK